MTALTAHIFIYLYWVFLLLLTSAALAGAVLAFRLQKRVYAIGSAGALAAALLVAAVPMPDAPSVFGIVLGMIAVGLAAIGGGPITVFILDLATKNTVPPGSHGGILVEDGTTHDAVTTSAVHEVLRGGLTIGILERVAVAGAIIAGFPEALAVVIAIKGVGRFTELSAAEARERFIIGTFASLIWACACAALVRLAVT